MKRFEAKKVVRSHTVTLAADAEVVFPLLCPVREEQWVTGWEDDTYELVYSSSGFNEEGCIFRSSYPDGNDSLWIATKFDAQSYRVEFVVHSELLVRKVDIRLNSRSDCSSNATFAFTLTAISPKGNAVVDSYSDAAHQKSVEQLSAMLNHFLKTGKKAAPLSIAHLPH